MYTDKAKYTKTHTRVNCWLLLNAYVLSFQTDTCTGQTFSVTLCISICPLSFLIKIQKLRVQYFAHNLVLTI